MEQQLFTLYLSCPDWWKAIEAEGYITSSGDNDTVSMMNIESTLVPRIGERFNIEGSPYPADWFEGMSAKAKKRIDKVIYGAYRVVDVCHYIEFVDPDKFGKDHMGKCIDITLEKISKKLIRDYPE